MELRQRSFEESEPSKWKWRSGYPSKIEGNSFLADVGVGKRKFSETIQEEVNSALERKVHNQILYGTLPVVQEM